MMRKSLVIWVLVAVAVLTALIAGLLIWKNSQGTDAPTPQPQNEIVIDITIVGDETVTIPFGDSYTDAGASAAWHYTNEPHVKHALALHCDNPVDVTKPGIYTVTYSAEYNGIRQTAIRTINVADTEAPVIQLVTNPDSFTLPNQEYQEEGFTATDNYDGDITDKVERILSEDKKSITYRVSDSSGNITEVVREIVFKDPNPPVLTLKGDKKITITAGDGWKEPGYTAQDNVDGDLTDKVEISGSVNHRSAGTYELTYTVTDQYGNKTTATRTVVVKAVSKPETDNSDVKVDGTGKVIYLTFDDGPSKHTERLLQVLEKYDVKATFFVCKTGRLDLLDDIAAAGHSIGVHSTSHKYSQIYASEDAFFEDFDKMVELIEQYAGITPTISRFPGGTANSVSKKHNPGIMTRLSKSILDLGFQYFDWNVDSNDAGGTKTADGVYKNVINRIAKHKSNHLVVLQHDIHSYSVDAVERIILWGLENGYTFASLTNSSPACHHTPVN